MHIAAYLSLILALGTSATGAKVRIDATVVETEANCFVCRVAVVGEPVGVVLAARELNVETGGTMTTAWSDEPTPTSWIDYDAACTVAADGSKATVVLKVRARKWPGEYSGTHTAIVKLRQ